jgi:hypothetical protein
VLDLVLPIVGYVSSGIKRVSFDIKNNLRSRQSSCTRARVIYVLCILTQRRHRYVQPRTIWLKLITYKRKQVAIRYMPPITPADPWLVLYE